MYTIDINSDVGEGIGNEAALLPFLSSCNIACGGHAGDDTTLQEVIRLASIHKVKIGAHPSYPDRSNFGRKTLNISKKELTQSVSDQIWKVKTFAERQHQKIHHIKPHGALYNQAAVNEEIAKLIIDVICDIDDTLLLYVPYKSVIENIAQSKIRTCTEGFADRNYKDDYTLVQRSEPKALIKDPDKVIQHVLPMVKEQMVHTVTGKKIPFTIDTLCVHGDTSTAFEILDTLHTEFKKHQIKVT